MSIITREVNSVDIGQRAEDGYVNLTKIAQAAGKRLGHYLENNGTQAFLEVLSVDIGIPISGLTQVQKGGNPNEQGTWAHPQVAIHFAQWCSPQFAVLVSKWVFDWMTKGTSPTLEPAPQAVQLQIEPETITIVPHAVETPPFSLEEQTHVLSGQTPSQIIKLLHRVKPVDFCKSGNRQYLVNEQLVQYFQVPIDVIRSFQTRYKPTLKEDGLKSVTGESMRVIRRQAGLSENISILNAWTPRAVLRLAMVLEGSTTASRIRAELGKTPVVANPQPIPPETKGEDDSLSVLEKTIELGEKLGGFNSQQQQVLRDGLLNHALSKLQK